MFVGQVTDSSCSHEIFDTTEGRDIFAVLPRQVPRAVVTIVDDDVNDQSEPDINMFKISAAKFFPDPYDLYDY